MASRPGPTIPDVAPVVGQAAVTALENNDRYPSAGSSAPVGETFPLQAIARTASGFRIVEDSNRLSGPHAGD